MIHGIINGSLIPDVEVIGSCSGEESSSFKCEGMKNFVKWNVNLGDSDFKIESEFKVEQVAGTALSFVLWSGDTKGNFVLDGKGQNNVQAIIYENAFAKKKKPLGKTNLDPSKFQIIVVRRTGNSVKIALDGKEVSDVDIASSIDAIGWRPWRNTIYIKSLKFNYGNSEI